MKYILTLGLFLCCGLLVAQEEEKDKKELPKLPPAIVLDFQYGMQSSVADMRDRYNFNFTFAGRVHYLTPKNWFFTTVFDYQFSEQIRIDVVAPLRNADGFIIDSEGVLADVQQGQRGFYTGLAVGRLFPISKKNRRLGIEASLGAGYWQHWVRIRLLSKELVQLQGDYKKGYDRLTSGPAMQQYVGIRYFSRNRLVNLMAGFDFTQGITQNRRPINYDTGLSEQGSTRFDMLIGFRVGLSLPLYMSTIEMIDEDIWFY